MSQRVAPRSSSRRPAAGDTRPLSPSSRPHRFAAALLRQLDGVWVELTPDLARQLAQKSTAAIAATVRQQRERTAERAEAVAYRRMEQALLIEEREAERRNKALWKRVKVKTPKEAAPERKAHRPTRGGFLSSASPLPSYAGAIVDRLGRRSVFVRIRYYGRKTTRPGVGRRVTIYIFEGAVERADGSVCLFSNIAETPAEAIAAMELLEQVNREGSVDAKLLFHLIANLPHQLTLDQMVEEARRFAEAQFGSRDLPYVVALHPPSEEGDQRNWHLHLLASTRPMRRVGDHEWELGELLRTEIDNPEGFRRMRELYAEIQTEVAQEAGLNLTYTALSNAARGLPVRPQEHLGGQLTDMARRSETVAANERNRETVIAGERAILDERLRHEQEAAVHEAALVGRALAGFARVSGEPVMAVSAVPASGTVSNLKHAALYRVRSASASPLVGRRVPPLLATASPGRSGLAVPNKVPASADALVVASAIPATMTPAPATSTAVSNLKHGPLPPALAASAMPFPGASPLPDVILASRSRLVVPVPDSALGQADAVSATRASEQALSPASFRSAFIGMRSASLRPLPPAATVTAAQPVQALVPRSALISPPGPLAERDDAIALRDGPHVHDGVSKTPLPSAMPRQGAVALRRLQVPAAVLDGDLSVGRDLSRSVPASKPAMADVRPAPSIPAEARVPNHDMAALMRLVARRGAEARRRKAERERRAAITLAAEQAATEQAATEHAALAELRRLDPLVNEFLRKGLAVADDVLAALGRDHEWERTAPVQRVLRAMLDDQNERLDRLDSAPDGTPPVTMIGGRLVPAGHLASDLARSVERWSDDPSFRAMATAMWPAPSPEPAPPVRSTIAPPDDIDRARRWAAMYRERLMVASDATERWDRDAAAVEPGKELAQFEQPARKPGLAARVVARHLSDLGRGG